MFICKGRGTSHHQVPQRIDDRAPLFGTSKALEEPDLLFINDTNWSRGNKFGEKVDVLAGIRMNGQEQRRVLSSNQSYRRLHLMPYSHWERFMFLCHQDQGTWMVATICVWGRCQRVILFTPSLGLTQQLRSRCFTLFLEAKVRDFQVCSGHHATRDT
jgi:hypothetical protein